MDNMVIVSINSLVFQFIQLVEVAGFKMLVYLRHDRQGHRRLGGGYDHYKQGKHLPFDHAILCAEGYQVNIGCIQDQFDSGKDYDDVTLGNHDRDAYTEKNSADKQVMY